MESFARRLRQAIERTGPLAVGLDPLPDRLPAPFAGTPPDLSGYGRRVVDLLAGRVPLVKVQVAFYERWGAGGWRALLDTAAHARERGLLVMADAKRGDIATTAEAYADAFFPAFDAVTVNPYLGLDGVRPFLDRAAGHGGAVFVLVRTSNPSAATIQDLDVGGEPLHLRVARLVAGWDGGGDVGAVVGATAPEHLARLRAAMPTLPFLIPGLGAQGGRASDLAAAFDAEGGGVLASSSRAILFAEPDDWEGGIVRAVERTIDELAAVRPTP